LASKAKEVFENSQPDGKNKILRTLLANPTLHEKKAPTTPVKAFLRTCPVLKSQNWLRLVETLRTASNNFEDYEFEDLAATIRQYEPELALSFGEL